MVIVNKNPIVTCNQFSVNSVEQQLIYEVDQTPLGGRVRPSINVSIHGLAYGPSFLVPSITLGGHVCPSINRLGALNYSTKNWVDM